MTVLPRPGTPSSSTWPPAITLIRIFRITSCWPTITLPTSVSIRVVNSRNWSGVMVSGAAAVVMGLASLSYLLTLIIKVVKVLLYLIFKRNGNIVFIELLGGLLLVSVQ